MWACDRLRELIEQRLLNLGKFCGIHDFEDVFHFVKEHNFFSTVDFRPVSQQPQHDLFERQPRSDLISEGFEAHLFSQSGVLLQKLHDAIC